KRCKEEGKEDRAHGRSAHSGFVQQYDGDHRGPGRQRRLLVKRRISWFQGFSERNTVRRPASRPHGGEPRPRGGNPHPRGQRERPRLRTRFRDPSLANSGTRSAYHSRRDSDSPQRLPSAEEKESLIG